MHLCFALLIVLVISFGNGYPVAESESGSVPRHLEEQKSESIQKPFQDIEEYDDGTTEEDEKWMKDVEDRFTGAMLRLLEGTDELYKDESFANIVKSMKAMEMDEDYVKRFVETLRKQDAAKRKQFDEVMMNKLDFSPTDFRDLLEMFKTEMKSGPSATSKSV